MSNEEPQVVADGRRSVGRRIVALFPLVIVIGVAAFVAIGLLAGDRPSDPVAIDASGPTFSGLDQLVSAADVVVEGRIISSQEGRVITDPTDPTAGFSTRLFSLDVVSRSPLSSGGTVTIEQESALLDGTPIVVNEMSPHEVGDVGFWFLIGSQDDEFPYLAVVNEQARLLVDADGNVDVFGEATGADILRRELGLVAP